MPGTPTSVLPDHLTPYSSLVALRKLESPVVLVIEDFVVVPALLPRKTVAVVNWALLGMETLNPCKSCPSSHSFPPLPTMNIKVSMLVLSFWSGPQTPVPGTGPPWGHRTSLPWVGCHWDPTLLSASLA